MTATRNLRLLCKAQTYQWPCLRNIWTCDCHKNWNIEDIWGQQRLSVWRDVITALKIMLKHGNVAETTSFIGPFCRTDDVRSRRPTPTPTAESHRKCFETETQKIWGSPQRGRKSCKDLKKWQKGFFWNWSRKTFFFLFFLHFAAF